jgi:hypothetical protein
MAITDAPCTQGCIPVDKYKLPYPRGSDDGNNDFLETMKRYVNSPPNTIA